MVMAGLLFDADVGEAPAVVVPAMAGDRHCTERWRVTKS